MINTRPYVSHYDACGAPPVSVFDVQGRRVSLHSLHACVFSKHTSVFTGIVRFLLVKGIQSVSRLTQDVGKTPDL